MAFRAARDSDLEAREGIKGLLSPSSPITISPPANISKSSSEPDRWDHCLELLVEDILSKKTEFARLNKARKNQIEAFLRSKSNAQVTLESALQSRVGSPEQEALQLFAYQASVFHLLQILLVKRWVDLGLAKDESTSGATQTLNWQITSFLKKNCAKKMLARHDWSFLKQNIYSWYSPSTETLERIRLHLNSVDLAKESNDFLVALLENLGAKSRLSLLGFHPNLISTKSLWRLLIEQKIFDQRLNSASELNFASDPSHAILLSGLRNGESLNSLRELSQSNELHGVWAFTNSELERFLSEILILWSSASDIPQINIHSRSLLKEQGKQTRSAPLFGDPLQIPHHAQLAACFSDAESKELEDSTHFLKHLRENGLLLMASEQFWPTENCDNAQKMRDFVLRTASVRLILDLRQLSCSGGESFPKGIFILEKCSSKEVRDSNRPQIIRLRGHVQKNNFDSIWSQVIEHIRHEHAPGEVVSQNFQANGDNVRMEAMAAAASQNQLKVQPWITLSDPHFYEVSGKLRRNLSKAYTFGTIMRWKHGTAAPSPRAIFLQERSDRALQAVNAPEANLLNQELPQYLFLPESRLIEDPLFYSAQMLSAPIQFWHRLESEQTQNQRSNSRLPDRQSEQRLKFMPMVNLFEPGTLLPVATNQSAFASIEDLKKELIFLFRPGNLGLPERIRLHQIIISLENSIRQNMDVCAEFTKHLYPDLQIYRWDLISTLPDIAPDTALELFRHLDRNPITHHPSIHITKLKNINDFKVTNASFQELPLGTMGELQVFHGIDAVLKLSGPSLLLKAAYSEIQKRIGRPWLETAGKIQFPTDFFSVQNQLREILRSITQQLNSTRDCIALMDQIFCCLFSLSPSFENDSARQAIRHHLSPDEGRINVQFQKEIHALIKPKDSVSPIGYLQ